jgi:DUF2934 family protein
LYLGVLVDFFYDQAGNLDRVLLEGVRRRDFTKDDIAEESVNPYLRSENWFSIKGSFFVLRMSEVITMNLDYITTMDLEELAQMVQSEEQIAREESIRLRAYEIWLQRGRPEGQSNEIWLEAERQVDAS